MADLLKGKRGLVMGVANDRSIAWGIARVLAGQGAKLAFTYQGDAFGRRAIPLAQSVGAALPIVAVTRELYQLAGLMGYDRAGMVAVNEVVRGKQKTV